MTTLALGATALASTADSGSDVGAIILTVVLLAVLLGGVVLFIAGLVSALRSRNYAAGGKAIWVLLMFAFPFLGPLVWFLWGRNSTLQPPRQQLP